jgi:DNA-binding winged helix-turn-helix (wHTH) protein
MPSPPSARAELIYFPPYRLDLRAGQLYRDGTPVRVRPKTFAVLQHLAERPGELATKQALLDAVWGDVAVSEDVVRLSVGELREILGDTRAAPRFIETVPRRGYRFIATMGDVRTRTPLRMAEPASDDSFAGDGIVVGRARERSEIAEWLRAAAGGARQIGFVTGEAGIGKTTLVDTALRDLARDSGARLAVARGQCIEHYGAGEPYLPVSAALAALCRGRDGPRVAATLHDHAPGWFLGAMGVAAPGEVGRAEKRRPPRTRTRCRGWPPASMPSPPTPPLVLVLEDMQWSDYSTVDLLSVVALRREPAQLLVLCTLRPAEAIVRTHPVATVKRELLRKGLGREIPLGGLSAGEVGRYLAARFPAVPLPDDVLPLLVDRSEGNPFFLVTLVDHLLERRLLVDGESGWELRGGGAALRTAIPDGLRAVIEPRLDRLAADELRVLEAASVAGPEFAAHAVAGAAPQGSELAGVEAVEQLC